MYAATILASAGLVSVASAAGIPTFPTEWNADSASKILIFQGGTKLPDGSACCDKKAPQCKVQAQGQSGKQYVDGANNRTALVVGGQAIFNFYEGNPSGKVRQFSAIQNGSAWQCKEWCPFEQGEGEYFDPLKFDPSAQDQGTATVDGKSYEKYHWFDSLFKVIHMDEQTWYVDESGTKPVPFMNVEKLTPFGGAEIGESTSAWDTFTEGPSDAIFNVQGLDTCQKGQCGQQQSHAAYQQAIPGAADMKFPSFATLAKAKVGVQAEVAAPRKLTSAAAAAAWPSDWSAMESSGMVINQGGQPSKDGESICCASDFGSQCQIQIQYSEGQRYYDHTNQRSRLEDPVNGIEVDDFKAHKSMLVVHNGTHDVCEKYCPIDPRDTLDAGKTHFLDDNATDLGTATFMNQTAEHWQWKQTIFKVITMQTSDFYAVTSGKTVQPLGRVDKLTPFGGPQIGQGQVSYENFQAGTPSADKFNIQGMDTCPQDPQCGQQSRQLNRLALGQMHTFWTYAEQH